MSYIDIIQKFESFDIEKFNAHCTPDMVSAVLSKSQLTHDDLCILLSDAASGFLEEMAQKAHILTKQQFGNSIFLFTPMYISNFCDNVCPYCSFACQQDIVRKHLSIEEIEQEADHIVKKGIRHLLVLTGESRKVASPEYITAAVLSLSKRFSSIAVEIYSLTEKEYEKLVLAGADGLTIYQETYIRKEYERLHRGGPKQDYQFRLEAPERAASAGMRAVTVGALFGLTHWRKEALYTALHAQYLQNKFHSLEVSVSFPRIRPLAGEFTTDFIVGDRQFVQMMAAIRLFLPSVGMTISTRESENFRNSILPLGVTKMSAGVSTSVGHGGDQSTAQFEIADERSVEQVKEDLLARGYQPVMHDWNRNYIKSV